MTVSVSSKVKDWREKTGIFPLGQQLLNEVDVIQPQRIVSRFCYLIVWKPVSDKENCNK